MKGHIVKRGTRYYLVVDVGRDPETGKRKQKWLSGYTKKKEAEQALSKLLTDINQGKYVPTSDTSLAEYLSEWLNGRIKDLSPTTVDSYKVIIEKHLIPYFGLLRLQDLRPVLVKRYYDHKLETLSGRTVLHHHRLLHKALSDAVRLQIIYTNAAASVDAPKAAKYKAQVLDKEGISALLAALEHDPLEVPVTLALLLGLRRGELLGLKWEDIDFDAQTITIRNNLVRSGKDLVLKTPKSETSERVLSLPAEMSDLLRLYKGAQDIQKNALGKYYNDGGFVFALDDGKPINPATFSHMFEHFQKAHGLNQIRFHDLRHTNATLMLTAGIAAKVASARLGHSTVSITLDLYTHILQEVDLKASEILGGIIFKKNDALEKC